MENQLLQVWDPVFWTVSAPNPEKLVCSGLLRGQQPPLFHVLPLTDLPRVRLPICAARPSFHWPEQSFLHPP